MIRTFACAVALLVAVPAYAAPISHDERAPASEDSPMKSEKTLDPFAKLDQTKLPLPPLDCMKRSLFEAALMARHASELVPLTPNEEMFYRGYYAAQQFTAPGFPIGDGVQMSVRAAESEDGEATLEGSVVFTLGEYLVCNRLTISDNLIKLIYQAGGAVPKDAK